MISIRNYLQADKTIEDTLLQVSQILIAGIERHSVEGPPGELARLRESTQQVLVAAVSHAPQDEVLGQAEHAMDALRLHNQHAVEYLRRPLAELQAKVKMLTDAITTVSSSSSENIRRLRQIKSQLVTSVDVREVRSYKLRLSECLDNILTEAERQRVEADRIAEQLNRSAAPPSSPDSCERVSPTDPATGLPDRAEAEEAIAQACQEEAVAFVVVMVVNQMQTLNGSFGREFGDLILRRFAAFLREQLPTVDQLFRWSGPTVIAMIRRKSMLDVRGVVEPLLLQRLSAKSLTGDLQVPISARWTVLPLMASPRLLFHKMDSFAQFA